MATQPAAVLKGMFTSGRKTKSPRPAKKVKFGDSTTKSGKTESRTWSGRPSAPIFDLDDDGSHLLTPSQRRSRRARTALERLQSPITIGGRRPIKWTPEHVEILADNIGVLLKSSETTPEVQEAQAIADRAVARAARSASPTPTRGSRKRPRSASTGHDSDDNDGPNDLGQTPSYQQPLKRIRMSNKVQVQPPIDLAKLAPQPLRITYKTHPLEDRSDEWYIEMFRRLFRMTERFVGHYFGVHDLDGPNNKFHEPWAVKMTPEFINWAEQVAEADPSMGGWDGVLRDTDQRKWFVMAILIRVLKIKIFDTDLWGANKEQKELMFGIERAFLTREGFARTELRSSTVRTIIGRAPVTQNFYSDVAVLTAQVSLLLKPLSDYLYAMPPQDPNQKLPKQEDQYQSLHNIISTAAYLSICIRLSPTIFAFNDISLGESYNPEDQWNLEMEYYTASKQKILNAYKDSREIWAEKLRFANEAIVALGDAGRQETKAGKKAAQAVIDIVAAQPPPLGQTHKPMVKMSVWPNIIRYKPGSDEDDKEGGKKDLNDKDGFRIFPIGKAAVVCYLGERDRGKKVRLGEHAEEKMRMHRGRERRILGVGGVATLAAVVTVGWVWRDAVSKRAGIDFAEQFGTLYEMASNVV